MASHHAQHENLNALTWWVASHLLPHDDAGGAGSGSRILAEGSTTSGADADGGKIPYGWSSTEEGISSYFVIFLSLLAFVLILSKLLHNRPRVASILPEAGMVLVVGITAGAIVYAATPAAESVDAQASDGGGGGGGANDDVAAADEVAEVAAAQGLLSFSSTTFFTALLPPIIFNSGYHLKRELFLRHLHPIVLFACVGTFVSTLVVALILQLTVVANATGGFAPRFSELLTFGALISATDPVSTLAVFQERRVDPQLFFLVFGESVLNDAVGLVTFNAFSKFVGTVESFERVLETALYFLVDFTISFAGSLVLGLLSGLCAAFLLKIIDMRRTRLLELSLYVLVMYLPFFAAEIFHMSGIVTILFTGMSARRYAEPNLSAETESDADVLFRVTAHLAETAIFLELGLSAVGAFTAADFYWQFFLWALLACLLGRALNVYPIALLYNRSIDGRVNRITNPASSNGGDDDPEGSLAFSFAPAAAASNADELSELKVKPNTAHMLWFSGLRGAVAYACSKMFPDDYGHEDTFGTTTMAVVLATVFVLGGTTDLALNLLKIDTDVDGDKYLEEKGHHPHWRGGCLNTFDERYVRPCVIRDYSETHRPATPRADGGRPCAVRDSRPDSPHSPDDEGDDDRRGAPTATDGGDDAAAAAAAVTSPIGSIDDEDDDHAMAERGEILRQMGLEYVPKTRRDSLYDYGAK